MRKSIYFDKAKKMFVNLDSDMMKQLTTEFPHVDLLGELHKMMMWLQSPKGSKRRGTLGFIRKWLGNAPTKIFDREIDVPQALQGLINKYLEDMWEKSNALPVIALNQRRT